MGKKKKKAADFRYDTGAARVAWAAVGESIQQAEIAAMIGFLCQPRPVKDGRGQPGKSRRNQYQAQLQKVQREVEKLVALSQPAGKLSLGSHVRALEELVARMLKVKYAVFLTNATAGFEIAYKYAGLAPGDEVIAPAITFIATIVYPLSIGAKVVLADIEPRTINMDPKDVERKITSRTKVIIPVHIGGYPVDMAPIMRLARKYDITVIEDAAHAFGGEYRGKAIGTIGHFGSFSFHEVKNINSLGEGGILCSNLAFGKDFSQARFVGMDTSLQIPDWLYDVRALKGKSGYFAAGNHSSTEIQAVCLASQIKRLKKIINKRRQAAAYLNRRFRGIEGIIPAPMDDDDVKATYHLYLLRIDPDKVGGDIQMLKKKLALRGVVQIAHFAPLYKFRVMRQLGYDTTAIKKGCPVTEEVFNHRFTHLPLYDFSPEQLSYMADMVIESVKEMKKGR
jgi:dTDP-4-amino-4,6-dideoxygalactose transaminase